MSKPEQTDNGKVERHIDEFPELEDLDLPGHLKEYRRLSLKAEEATAERKMKAEEIFEIVKAANVDTLLWTDSRGKVWRSTWVKPEAGEKVDEEKLRDAMAKIGKLNAAQIAAIFNAATVPTEPKSQYVSITPPRQSKAQ